jgi:ATP-dependent Clp protease ATP-binding subunit ClpA
MPEEQDRIEMMLDRAMSYASERSHEYVTLEHLLLSVVQEKEIEELLRNLSVNPQDLTNDLVTYVDTELADIIIEKGSNPRKTQSTERVFNRAVTQVIFSGRKQLEIVDIFISLLSEKNSYAQYFLKKHKVTRQRVIERVTKDSYQKKGMQQSQQGAGGEVSFTDFCTDLNKEAKAGNIDELIGREVELDEITHVLARRKKNNVIICGESGVGKTQMAEGLAKKIVDGNVQKTLKDKTVWSLDLAGMVAGTKFRGDFEERAKVVLDELAEKENAILFIDEIHMIVGAGSAGQSNIDMANLLKPLLAKGKLLCIGATTPTEYRENIEKDRALMRRFQKYDLDPPGIDDTIKILKGIQPLYEKFHQVKYDIGAVEEIVKMADKHLHGKHLPDKAIDVMDAAGATSNLADKPNVDIDGIHLQISKISKVPLEMIVNKQTENYADLEGKMKKKVFGQDDAIEKLTNSIMVAKAGLREANKPIGSYLFVGPTGVGKTEACKQLADNLGIKLLKYDMSEYQERHSVSKLIGAPPGYVGYAEGSVGSGQLINDVEDNPNCVLLLDEVEKAAPEVLQVLLQVMDDGRLSSSTGKTVNFGKVILIMTSNLGAALADKQSIGFGANANIDASTEEVKKFFAPEFRNRLDAVVGFNKLSEDNILKIIDKVNNETNVMLTEKNVKVELDDSAKQWLMKEGFDPSMGARPLKRVYEQQLKLPISKEILFGKLINGGMVKVSTKEGKLKIDYVGRDT